MKKGKRGMQKGDQMTCSRCSLWPLGKPPNHSANTTSLPRDTMYPLFNPTLEIDLTIFKRKLKACKHKIHQGLVLPITLECSDFFHFFIFTLLTMITLKNIVIHYFIEKFLVFSAIGGLLRLHQNNMTTIKKHPLWFQSIQSINTKVF